MVKIAFFATDCMIYCELREEALNCAVYYSLFFILLGSDLDKQHLVGQYQSNVAINKRLICIAYRIMHNLAFMILTYSALPKV